MGTELCEIGHAGKVEWFGCTCPRNECGCMRVYRVEVRGKIWENAAGYGLLSADERERASRFKFEKDRNLFITSRVALRSILSRHLQTVSGDAIKFSTTVHGKPYISWPSNTGLTFNLSHTGDRILVAVSHGSELGIDIESVGNARDPLALAQRFFSDIEYGDLLEVPSCKLPQMFTRCWTLKEAYVKAVGLGLSLPLASFSVPIRPDDLPWRLEWTDIDGKVETYSLVDVPVPVGFYGALAFRGYRKNVVVMDFPWEREFFRT